MSSKLLNENHGSDNPRSYLSKENVSKRLNIYLEVLQSGDFNLSDEELMKLAVEMYKSNQISIAINNISASLDNICNGHETDIFREYCIEVLKSTKRLIDGKL